MSTMSTSEGARVGMNPVKRMLAKGDKLVLRKWTRWPFVLAINPRRSNIENDDLMAAINEVYELGEQFWRLGPRSTRISRGETPNWRLVLLHMSIAANTSTITQGVEPSARFFDNEEDAFSLSSIGGMETGRGCSRSQRSRVRSWTTPSAVNSSLMKLQR